MFSRRQTSPMARRGSTAQDDVVPTVAQTIAGTAPAARSAAIAASSASTRIAYRSSASTSRRLSRPRPAIFTPFSIEEWAWREV